MSVTSISPLPQCFERLEQGIANRSFCGRIFTPSLEKVVLLCNSVLLVIAIAHAYFTLELPFLALALGLYGFGTLFLRGKVTSPTEARVARLEADLHAQREHNKLLQEKINQNLHGEEMKDALAEDIRTLEARLHAVQRDLALTESR